MSVSIKEIRWGTMDLKTERFAFGEDPDNDNREIQLKFTKGAARSIGSMLLEDSKGDGPFYLTVLGRVEQR